MSVDIKNLTRRRLTAPRNMFSAIAKEVLPDWEISLVFVGPKKARVLNEQLRHKEYIPNVLSYKLGEKSGEIFICPQEAAKQALLHHMSEKEFILSLFIHGLLHIKGWAHGATMERCERKLLAQFCSHVPENSHRH